MKQASASNNSGVILLLVALGIQLTAIIGSVVSIFAETFSVAIQVFSTVSTMLVFIASIICLVRSRNAVNHNGKVLGIVFTVLTSILMTFVLMSLAITGTMLMQSSDGMDSVHAHKRKEIPMVVRVDKIDEDTQKAVDFATEQLCYSLNDCDTINVRLAKAAVLDGNLDDQYIVYFQYSTENVSSECRKVHLYKVDSDDALGTIGNPETFHALKVISIEIIESIPDSVKDGELYGLDHNHINARLEAIKHTE